MKKLVLALGLALLTTPALAHPVHKVHHHAHVHRYASHHRTSHRYERRRGSAHAFHHRNVHYEFRRRLQHHAVGAYAGTASAGRPGDCAGIPWCGCWLRHVFGIADKAFNLAAHWATFGSPGAAAPGNIAVYRHHVALIRGNCDGAGCVMISGNDGHAVRTRYRSLRGAIAIRQPSGMPNLGWAGS